MGPDILVMAKGIASGLPLSGILAPREILARWAPGAHGGTYGGNVVTCAAANATLDVIRDEGLVANAAERGRQLLDGLRALKDRHPTIGDVRGLGCMVAAIEFVKPRQRRRPHARPGPGQARPRRGPPAPPDPAVGGLLGPGRADHPAAGDHGRGGRPGAIGESRHHARPGGPYSREGRLAAAAGG